jgi:hypothetical protein
MSKPFRETAALVQPVIDFFGQGDIIEGNKHMITQTEAKPLVIAEWDRHALSEEHDATTFCLHLSTNRPDLLAFRVGSGDKYECIKSWLCQEDRIKL